jgi:hypothetical protein
MAKKPNPFAEMAEAGKADKAFDKKKAGGGKGNPFGKGKAPPFGGAKGKKK